MEAITKSGSFEFEIGCPCAPDGKISMEHPRVEFYGTQVDPQYPELMKVAATVENVWDCDTWIPEGMHGELCEQLNQELKALGFRTTDKLLEVIIKPAK